MPPRTRIRSPVWAAWYAWFQEQAWLSTHAPGVAWRAQEPPLVSTQRFATPGAGPGGGGGPPQELVEVVPAASERLEEFPAAS